MAKRPCFTNEFGTSSYRESPETPTESVTPSE